MMKKILPVVAAIAAFALQVLSVYMPGDGENVTMSSGAAPELSAVIFSALLSAAVAGVIVHLVLSFLNKKKK